MKITKKQLKDLIREQVAAVLEGHDEYHEDDWFDILAGERGSPISFDPDGTEASMTPNEEVEAENALMAAVDALSNAGYTPEEIRDLLMDVAPEQEDPWDRGASWEDDASWQEEERDMEGRQETSTRLSSPKHDPMDRSALGKYRRGKMTNFTEEKDDDWIQDAEKDIERRGTEGVCTGKNFGSKKCPPGSKRYNLAKTFRKMAKKRKKK